MHPSPSHPHPPRVLASILQGPLTPDHENHALLSLQSTSASTPLPPGTVGSSLRFHGIVRKGEPRPDLQNQLHDLIALDYQTYDPMAERQLLALALETAHRHALSAIAALHSRGTVHVGETSFILIIQSPHRAESLAAMAEFIDRMKQDVPIWKRPLWANPTTTH